VRVGSVVEGMMKEVKSIDLFVSDDQSEVLVSRRAMIHKPEGFSARIGSLIHFGHLEFFGDVSGILTGFLEEETLRHHEKWPAVGGSEIDRTPKSGAMRKYLKRFKQLSVVTGGYNPPGISVSGLDSRDEIHFTFQSGDDSVAVAEMFCDALVKAHWWES
jgi:hypothetical protein